MSGLISLKLYVAGSSSASMAAINAIGRVSKSLPVGKLDLEIIDLLKTPEMAADHQIIALPTLIKFQPEPQVKIVGDLSDDRKLLVSLGLSNDNDPTLERKS